MHRFKLSLIFTVVMACFMCPSLSLPLLFLEEDSIPLPVAMERQLNKQIHTKSQQQVGEDPFIHSSENSLLFEGDIEGVLQPGKNIDDLVKSGVFNTKRWPGGWVYYEIDPSFSSTERQNIFNAMNEFQSYTDAVRFYTRGTRADYVYIKRGAAGSGCSSSVGRKGGKQTLNLEVSSKGTCMSFNTIVHEMMHAAGFWHEQSRPDRNTHVDINWNNIPEDKKHNFNTYTFDQVTHYSSPYDYRSLMHYSKNAFAITPSVWTVRPKPAYSTSEIKPYVGLSPTDSADLNAMYPLCAILYTDASYKGSENIIIDGLNMNMSSTIRSLEVVYGCTLTAYKAQNYGGTSVKFTPTSATARFWNLVGGSWDQSIRSVKCSC